MHVCLVFHSPFPNTFSTAIQETVRHLTDRIDVTIVSASDTRKTTTWNGATVHKLVSDTSTAKSLDPTWFGIRANQLVAQLAKTEGVDLVHIHAFPALGAVLTMTPRIPVIADIRGTAVSNQVFEFLSRQGLKFQRFLVNEMITVSDPVARHIFGPDPDVSIVPLGVDLAKFDPEIVSPIEMDSDGVTAIYTGHLHPARELTTLIDSFHEAQKEIPSLECIIVGDGAARPTLEQYAAERGLSDSIHFAGSVAHDAIPRWLANADIGLAYVADKPQYRHQPPIKTVEYLAAGLPVVGTNTEGNEQFVTGDTGVLTEDTASDYGTGLVKLAKSHTDFPIADLRKSVRRYDYEYIVENDLLPVYRRVAGK